MRESDIVVILHTDSRESVNKAVQFESATKTRGMTARLFCPGDKRPSALLSELGSDRVVVVIPCSDSLAWIALEIAMVYGLIPETSTLPFLSKSSGYNLFGQIGFQTLLHHEVQSVNDIINSPIDGQVFVKPDWSSGVHSVSPWGYKQFATKYEFAQVVGQDLQTFAATSKNPHARLMMMEYVPHDGVYCISAVMRKDKVACFGHSFMAISGDDHFYDYVLYDDVGGTKALEPLIEKLWDAGFRSNFLYLQCLIRDGVLYPMDVNTRLSTYLDTLATTYDPGFHGRALDFITGRSDELTINLPAKSCLIGRVRSDPHRPITSFTWQPQDGLIPLNFDRLSTSNAAYDKAYSWPTYLCNGESASKVLAIRQKFLSTVEVIQ